MLDIAPTHNNPDGFAASRAWQNAVIREQICELSTTETLQRLARVNRGGLAAAVKRLWHTIPRHEDPLKLLSKVGSIARHAIYRYAVRRRDIMWPFGIKFDLKPELALFPNLASISTGRRMKRGWITCCIRPCDSGSEYDYEVTATIDKRSSAITRVNDMISKVQTWMKDCFAGRTKVRVRLTDLICSGANEALAHLTHLDNHQAEVQRLKVCYTAEDAAVDVLFITRIAAIECVAEIEFGFLRYDSTYAARCAATEVAAAFGTALLGRLRVKIAIAFHTFSDVIDKLTRYYDSTQLLHTLVIICPMPTPAEQIALHRQAFGSTSSKTTCNDRRLLDYIQINILHRVDGVDTSYHSDVLEKDSDLPRSLAWLCSPFVGNPDDCNLWYYSEYRRDNGTLRDTGTNSKAFVGAMKEIVKGRDASRRPGWARIVRPYSGDSSGTEGDGK